MTVALFFVSLPQLDKSRVHKCAQRERKGYSREGEFSTKRSRLPEAHFVVSSERFAGNKTFPVFVQIFSHLVHHISASARRVIELASFNSRPFREINIFEHGYFQWLTLSIEGLPCACPMCFKVKR